MEEAITKAEEKAEKANYFEMIFERYKQVNKSFTREHEGNEFIIELPAKIIRFDTLVPHGESYMANKQNFIERMNIEFSDIYN